MAPFMDRDKVTKATAQTGFISFVLIDLKSYLGDEANPQATTGTRKNQSQGGTSGNFWSKADILTQMVSTGICGAPVLCKASLWVLQAIEKEERCERISALKELRA